MGSHCPLETLLEPSQTFTVVQDGEYVGHDISPNLHMVVVAGQHVQVPPLNFFQRDYGFEKQLQGLMVKTALLRLQEKIEVRQPIA
ncbi:hypothetical protein V1515DRAFT_583065 [Lipomyces mesembrius]